MIEFREPGSGVVENSLFGVWKVFGKSQRVIWGGNRSNLLFRPEASKVELPTPDIISTFRLPPGRGLFLSGCDVRQFYNKIRAPAFLIPYLGLPRVPSDLVETSLTSRFVVPCLRCIPMGATFAVAIAQAVSTAVVRASGYGVGSPFDSLRYGRVEHHKPLVLPYIDDLTSVGSAPRIVDAATSAISAAA